MLGHRSPCLAAVMLVALVTTGCDIDDGRQLADPVFPPPTPTTTTVAAAPELVEVAATEPPATVQLQLVAPWRDGSAIPDRYTCLGDSISPALTWTGVPDGTAELAVSLTASADPTDVRWLVLGIAASETGFVEGQVPDGASAFLAAEGSDGYAAPCPPVGQTERYVFTVYALAQQYEPTDETTGADVIANLEIVATVSAGVTGSVGA